MALTLSPAEGAIAGRGAGSRWGELQGPTVSAAQVGRFALRCTVLNSSCKAAPPCSAQLPAHRTPAHLCRRSMQFWYTSLMLQTLLQQDSPSCPEHSLGLLIAQTRNNAPDIPMAHLTAKQTAQSATTAF